MKTLHTHDDHGTHLWGAVSIRVVEGEPGECCYIRYGRGASERSRTTNWTYIGKYNAEWETTARTRHEGMHSL